MDKNIPNYKFDVIGVGLLISKDILSLFTLSKIDYWKKDTENNRTIISYGCVGGKVEKNETLVEAAEREAYEEIGTDVKIYNSKKTICIDLDLKTTIEIGHEVINPFSTYIVSYPGKPGNPNLKDTSFLAKISVFKAKLLGIPEPSSEVPAILYSDWNLVKQNINNYLPIKNHLKHGKIISTIELPKNSYIIPMWTPEILGKTLDYKSLIN